MSIKNKFGEDVVVLWKDRKRWCGLPLSFTRYYLLEKPNQWVKLICDKGLLTTKFEEILAYRIDDLTVEQTLTNKIWGVGTIHIKSDDKSSPEFKIIRVNKPYQVYDMLASHVARDRKNRNFRWGEYSD